MTCWACKCHTTTTKKQESKNHTSICGFLVIAHSIPIPARERDTKILETEQKYILCMNMAQDTKIHTAFSWSWCTCHSYAAPVLWSSSAVQILCFIQTYYSIQWQKFIASISQSRVNQICNQNFICGVGGKWNSSYFLCSYTKLQSLFGRSLKNLHAWSLIGKW